MIRFHDRIRWAKRGITGIVNGTPQYGYVDRGELKTTVTNGTSERKADGREVLYVQRKVALFPPDTSVGLNDRLTYQGITYTITSPPVVHMAKGRPHHVAVELASVSG